MNRTAKIVIVINLIALMVYFNSSIRSKESILSNGKMVYLSLIPIGERSPIQGESVRLFYQITDILNTDSIPKRGYAVISIGPDKVGSLVRVQKDRQPLSIGEYLVEYTTMFRDISVGAGYYLIQENKANDYGTARYGGLVIDDKGNSVLIGLYDEDFNKLDL